MAEQFDIKQLRLLSDWFREQKWEMNAKMVDKAADEIVCLRTELSAEKTKNLELQSRIASIHILEVVDTVVDDKCKTCDPDNPNCNLCIGA